ncbi:MAG: shikimate kinase [Lachnospiraceae bacterium]|nr:shikimate kinase [Lachnospiraceae bacterium]
MSDKLSNIILIGMPGVGKSSVGVILAKILGYRFLDCDLVIQEKEGKLLHEIISSEGLDGFIKVENKINASINCEKCIVATGGSAIYGEDAMAHFKEIGTIVYLKSDYETIAERLGDLAARGVAMKEGQTLKDLYEERVPLYEKYADVIVDESGCRSVRETILKLLEKIKK